MPQLCLFLGFHLDINEIEKLLIVLTKLQIFLEDCTCMRPCFVQYKPYQKK